MKALWSRQQEDCGNEISRKLAYLKRIAGSLSLGVAELEGLLPRTIHFLAACVWLMPSISVAAEDDLHYTLVDLFPYGWDEAGESKGLFVDLARVVDRALGSRLPIILEPISRIRRDIDNGHFDFTITYRMAKLEPQAQYLLDLGCLRTSVVSMKTRPVRAVEDLTGKTIAYSGSGYFSDAYAPWLDLQAVEVSQTDAMFKMALRGRLDAFVIDELVWQSFKRNWHPGYSVPSGGWLEFAPLLYLESMPLSISASQSAADGARAAHIRELGQNDQFMAELRSLLVQYGLRESVSCLTYADSSFTE